MTQKFEKKEGKKFEWNGGISSESDREMATPAHRRRHRRRRSSSIFIFISRD